MPVRQLLIPLGPTTSATHCGDCPHLERAHPFGGPGKHSCYCTIFEDSVLGEGDYPMETAERHAMCILRERGR